MLRSKLIYLLLLAGVAAFYVLYIDSFPLLMLVSVLAAPFLLLAGLLWLAFRSESRLSCQTRTCTAGDAVAVTVTADNRSPFFFSRAEAQVNIIHAFGAQPEVVKMRFPLHEKNATRLTFYIHPMYCGQVELRLMKVRVYDLFRLFHVNMRSKHDKMHLLVLPKPLLLPLDESAPPVEEPESMRFADKPGDDPSEIFAIREYQPGDAVSRMHWKLSSRSETLFVKEFSSPVDKHAVLLAEYSPQGQAIQDAQGLLTVLYSLAWALIEAGQPVEVVWYDGEKAQADSRMPSSEETLAECFRALYGALLSMTADAEAFGALLGETVYSSATIVSNREDTVLLPFIEQKLAANQRSLLFISKTPASVSSDLTEIQTIAPDSISPGRIVV